MQIQVAEISKKLDSYDLSSDTRVALEYLTQQLDLMEITYGEIDQQLSTRLETYHALYKQEVLQDAMSAFSENGYAEAVRLLSEAQGLIGTEDEDIAKAIQYYEGFDPAWLADFEYFSREPGEFGSTYWNSAYDTLNTGSEGNFHEHTLYVDVSTRAATQTYIIESKYSVFCGTIHPPKESREMDEDPFFRVYGDEQLLYTSPVMREGVRSVPFSIDIKNVTQLTIAADSFGHSYYNTLCIGEAYLEP